jgi:hypothetical protein
VTNYAVLTFVIAAHVIRVLLMLFTVPLVARAFSPREVPSATWRGAVRSRRRAWRAENPSGLQIDAPTRAPRRG